MSTSSSHHHRYPTISGPTLLGSSNPQATVHSALSSSSPSSGPSCKCCPYGFHIDTDFVRYCDALLTALYGTNRSPGSAPRSFGSLRRKLNLALTTPELFPLTTHATPNPTARSFLPFCDFLNPPTHKSTSHHPNYHHSFSSGSSNSCFESNESSSLFYGSSAREYGPRSRVNGPRGGYSPRAQFFSSSASIETNPSTAATTPCEAESSLTEAVHKFEEVLHESSCSSKSTLYNGHAHHLHHDHHSPPPSPAPSSCPSSSTISRTVLTQIRNHLALSITRVKELEEQNGTLPLLQAKIRELELQNGQLLKQLTEISNNLIKSKAEPEPSPKASDSPVKSENIRESENILDQSAVLARRLSFSKPETISIVCEEPDSEPQVKSTRSIGTLTSFAPSLPPKNAFVQTELKGRDLLSRVPSASQGTSTDFQDLRVSEKAQIFCVSSAEKPEMVNSTTNTEMSDYFSTFSVPKQAELEDKAVSTSDLPLSTSDRPTSLDLGPDSLNPWLFPSKQVCSSTASPASSSASIRLCEKCHQMVNSATSDHLVDLTQAPTFASALPKIIKSDSGISVERNSQKIDKETADQMLLHLSGGYGPESAGELSSSMYTQSSASAEDAESPAEGGAKVKEPRPEKKPLDYAAVQPTPETMAALKVIHENLIDPKKSSSFLFSKSVSTIKKVWFKLTSKPDSDSRIVELYLDTFEKFSSFSHAPSGGNTSCKLLDYMVNLSDSSGNTAMHYAIACGNFDIVSVLLDSKVVDVNKFNKAGYTATMLASLAQLEDDLQRDVVRRLFAQADVNLKAKQNGESPLMLASSKGNSDICQMLLDCGAEVNLQDNEGNSALMIAAEFGHPPVISLLLSHPETDPLLEDAQGSDALKIALVNGHNEVGILLYTGTRISAYFHHAHGLGRGSGAHNTSTSSLSRLVHSPVGVYPNLLRRTGSFSYGVGGQAGAGGGVLSLRTSPPRNRHHSVSMPSSPSARS